jgi:hypothetical protein
MIRLEAGLSVVRFCQLAGIPQSTWYRHRAQALSGDRPVKGPRGRLPSAASLRRWCTSSRCAPRRGGTARSGR